MKEEYTNNLFAGEDKDYLIKMPYCIRTGITEVIFLMILIITIKLIVTT